MNTTHSRLRLAEGLWTILENLCHLANTEALFAERMVRVPAETRPPLPRGEQNAHIAAMACDQRVMEEVRALIQAIRRQMACILRASPPEAWSRVGLHSQRGEQTLEQLVQKGVNHVAHHRCILSTKRQALRPNREEEEELRLFPMSFVPLVRIVSGAIKTFRGGTGGLAREGSRPVKSTLVKSRPAKSRLAVRSRPLPGKTSAGLMPSLPSALTPCGPVDHAPSSCCRD